MRRLYLLFALVLFSGCSHQSAEDRIRIADQLEDAGKLDSALIQLDLAVGDHPNHLWAHLERGVMRSYKGDQDGAITDDSLVIGLDPKNITAYFNRALAKGRKSDHAGALHDLQQALRFKSREWKGPYCGSQVTILFEPVDNPALGIESSEFDMPIEAIAYQLALTYVELDSAEKADCWLTNCIGWKLNLSDCLYQRGILRYNHGHASDGCADLKRAADMHDTRAQAAWTAYCIDK